MSPFSGMIGDFLKQIVSYSESEESSSSVRRVAELLEAELLEGKIEVKRSTPEAPPEFLYRPAQAEEGLRMSHAAATVSELAPLVLFLKGVVEPGDVLIIEEPESHLHPGCTNPNCTNVCSLGPSGCLRCDYNAQQLSPPTNREPDSRR